MPCARIWTEEADLTIKSMRATGATWSAIGVSLGLSRNTVIERGRRLCVMAPPRTAIVPATRPNVDDPNRDPLPAGHPLTWGLLSLEEFPRRDHEGWGERQRFDRTDRQAA